MVGFITHWMAKYYAKLNGLTTQPLSLYTLYFNLGTQNQIKIAQHLPKVSAYFSTIVVGIISGLCIQNLDTLEITMHHKELWQKVYS